MFSLMLFGDDSSVANKFFYILGLITVNSGGTMNAVVYAYNKRARTSTASTKWSNAGSELPSETGRAASAVASNVPRSSAGATRGDTIA